MVYESEFYTTRRPYSRPTLSSYTSTSGLQNPRIYTVHDAPVERRANEQYSYSYSSKNESSSSSSDPYSRPSRSNYSSTVERRSTAGGPGGYSYESTMTTGGGPGGYSYSSTRSNPSGTRSYNFRV